jgi:twitching motility two-component system response regulator PilG
MSDTFEFSIPEPNPGNNFRADRMPADRTGSRSAGPDDASTARNSQSDAGASNGAASRPERRCRRRALISAPVRVRGVDVTEGGPDEISTTLDVSRGGLLFTTKSAQFQAGMVVAVTFPYSKSHVAVQAEQAGRVARIGRLPEGRYSVAVVLRSGKGQDLVDNGGGRLAGNVPEPTYLPELGDKKLLVMVVDKDMALRESLKTYLSGEGYEVIALASSAEAHHALEMFTPALLIAEIEGEDLPGYELCAYVKGTPRLQTVPVMLMTSSAYPSDYANAHSLGAVVCIAKPYRQERLGHVVRLLAPTRQAREQSAPARPVDASRRSRNGNATSGPGYSPNIRFRPRW